MEVPARGVLEGAALQEHPFAVPQGNEDRTQEGLDFHFIQRRVRIVERAGGEPGLAVALVRIPDIPLLGQHPAACENGLPLVGGDLALFHFAPGVAAAVESPAAGDGDVVRALGVDRREAAPYVQSLEVGVDDGIQVLVRVEDDEGVPLQVHLDATLQADRTGPPDARRHHQAAASLSGKVRDGGGECLRIQGDAVPYAAEVGQADRPGGNDGFVDLERFTRFHAGTAGGKGGCGNQDSQEKMVLHRLSVKCYGANIRMFSEFPLPCTEFLVKFVQFRQNQ